VLTADLLEEISLFAAIPYAERAARGADVSGKWAWVELNYRPHASQAISFDFHRRHSAVSLDQ
jgi:hypothetical protein